MYDVEEVLALVGGFEEGCDDAVEDANDQEGDQQQRDAPITFGSVGDRPERRSSPARSETGLSVFGSVGDRPERNVG
jgi:hypothetical protein